MIKNGCYKIMITFICVQLINEPPLERGRQYALDGNNSLKRLRQHGNRNVGDRRIFNESDYYLSAEYVKNFAHEVKARKAPNDEDDQVEPADSAVDASLVEQEGDPTDGTETLLAIRGCVKNWKSAAAEEKKRMWGIFDESGIFASACRHGIILWIADMIRSGGL